MRTNKRRVQHVHEATKRLGPYPFCDCRRPEDCNPKAHDGVRYIEACGLPLPEGGICQFFRTVNVNGEHEEVGPWYTMPQEPPRPRTLTPGLEERIRRMARDTWDFIGPDILENSGKSTLPRAAVVEAVQDADYMLSYGNDPEAFQFWKTLPAKKQDEVVGKAFPHDTYGY